ncbi:MAG: endonuclease MutS2 [Ruminococcus sp.]|jgi:DNA mismatch repair protein MutS2|nr:endonuclease MutS2 [Ruminococcus sp.]
MNNYYETLELPKILSKLEECCSNEYTKNTAQNLSPITDLETVRFECEKTDRAFSLSVKYGSPSFRNFADIRQSVSRAHFGASLTGKELLKIADMLSQIRALSDWYRDTDDEMPFSYLFVSLCPNKYLEEKIRDTFLTEDEIADTASPALADIRRKIAQTGVKIREHLGKMIKDTEIAAALRESIVTMRDGRYVLPVKAEHKTKISGMVHAASASGSTYFIEPAAVVEANNEIRILEGEEAAEIERILAQLSGMCAEMKETLESDFLSCTELNLYFAKASLAAKMRAGLPEISNDGEIILKKARHPLIDPKKIVPVDVTLGGAYSSLIVTGPNTGGKTVLLKTVGLLTAMTMCGLLIPAADGSKISVFDEVLVDIGDKQSIEESLSTFSSHMGNVAAILKTVNEKSLVLLDELGSGTDPDEGAALAVSIIEKIKASGARQIVVTHFAELKIYATSTSGVQNASCEFDADTLRPTYRLIIGSPGKSNAFYISKTLGVPGDVIENAKLLLTEENKRFDEAVGSLERARAETEAVNDGIRRELQAAKENAEELKKQLAELDKRKKDELEKARVQAMRIVESCRLESEEILRELREMQKKAAADQALVSGAKSKYKKALNKMYDTANPVTESGIVYKPPRDIEKGDDVLVLSLNKAGKVVTDPDNSGNVLIQAGAFKMKVHVSGLRLLEADELAPEKEQTSKTRKINIRTDREAATELDIRGMNIDEGDMETDMFLDAAVMSGLHTVRIIHGKGTGVLRKGIQQHLKTHRAVKSFRDGVYGEGENGVTIVELK